MVSQMGSVAVPDYQDGGMTPPQARILAWLANGETGTSSETMAFWLGFSLRKEDGSHPLDPSDFNRCLQLLHLVPELRTSLDRLAGLSPEWAALAASWGEIEASFLDEAGLGWTKAQSAERTYRLMKEILL